MSTHTPEPWAEDHGYIYGPEPEIVVGMHVFGPRDFARARICVNALADRDPSKLADLEKEMECAIACLSAIGATRPADNLAAALAAFRPNPPKRSPGPRLIAGMNKLRDRVKSGEFRKEAP